MKPVFAIAGLVVREIFRKKDFYVAFILAGAVLFYSARIQFHNASNAHRYLLDIGLGIGVWLAAALTVALTARQYPEEAKQKTLHVLLSKPVSRAQFVAGKFFGCFAAGCATLALFFLAAVGFTAARSTDMSLAAALQTFYLFCLSIGVLAALSLFFSFFMTTGANVSVSLLLYFLMSVYGVSLHASAAKAPAPGSWLIRAAETVLPHFGFFDMRQRFIHGWPPVSAGLVAVITLYALSYAAAALIAAWLVFRKKDVA